MRSQWRSLRWTVPGTRGSRTFQVRAGQRICSLVFFVAQWKPGSESFNSSFPPGLIVLLDAAALALITAICSHQHKLSSVRRFSDADVAFKGPGQWNVEDFMLSKLPGFDEIPAESFLGFDLKDFAGN